MLLALKPKTWNNDHDKQRAIIHAVENAPPLASPVPLFYGEEPVAMISGKSFRTSAGPLVGLDDMIRKGTQSVPKSWITIINKYTYQSGATPPAWSDMWPVFGGEPDGGTYPGTAATSYVHQLTDPGFPSLGPPCISPETRHITGITVSGQGGNVLWLYDRVMVYNACPFFNGTTTMTNTVTPTRYNGYNVQLMYCSQVIAGASAFLNAMTIVDDTGTSRVLSYVNYNVFSTATATAKALAIVSPGSGPTPFIPLFQGTNGVRSITSYANDTTTTGSLCFVLLKVIAAIFLPNGERPIHLPFRQQPYLQPIPDDACLSMLSNFVNTSFNNTATQVSIETIRG